MTVPASAKGFGRRLPSDKERAAANQIRQLLAAQAAGDAKLRVVGDDKALTEIVLSPAMSSVLLEVFRHIGRGDAVTLMPVSQMLTTQQAADILNVSRPFLISLLDAGKIPHTLVGRHRRIKANDLFDYKDARAKTRADALSELAALDAETF